MSQSIIIPASTNINKEVLKPTGTFTGEVYLEMLHADAEAAIANVTFTPCARAGWLCDKGAEARRTKAGDTIWAPTGTAHWHGADDGSIMTHHVIGVGETQWHDAVTDDDYKKRASD
ncbi:hypothetical protein ACMFMG_010284 [Clarireedia jacksonii]